MSTQTQAQDFKPEEKKVIFASSLGTVFEWYDFYLYATLAPFFVALFFPKGNDTAALLSSFATYAAGFLVRPFGAIVFGRVGDVVGRKYDFLLTIGIMGLATGGGRPLPAPAFPAPPATSSDANTPSCSPSASWGWPPLPSASCRRTRTSASSPPS